jgi:hypothetical protein
MAAIGLAPVGSATLRDNFDNFVLRKAAREALAEIDDPDQRELVRDHFKNQRFRRDVYGRGVPQLDDAERRERLLATTFALSRPSELITFKMGTEAGEVGFDNPVAHRIVEHLADGPRRLKDCVTADQTAEDVLANALSLACARAILPADPPASVDRVNAAFLSEGDAQNETALRALPWGTAVRFDSAALTALLEGKDVPEKIRPWAEFLKARG